MTVHPSVIRDSGTRARSTLSPWAQEVAERARELEDRLDHVASEHKREILAMLQNAELLAYERVRVWRIFTRIPDWWYGSRVEEAWSFLHEAELMYVEYADQRGLEFATETALDYASALDPADPVRVRFEKYIDSLGQAPAPTIQPVVPGEPIP